MKRKVFIRILLICLFGAALIGGAIYFVVRSGTMNDNVRKFAVNRINQYLAGKVSIESVEGDLLSSFEVRGVKIFDPDGGLVVDVDKANIEWSATAVAGVRELRIVISGARIKLVKTGDQWNITAIKKPKPKTNQPANLPRFKISLTVIESELYVSPSSDRTVHSWIPLAEAKGTTGGPAVGFEVTRLTGRVDSPALGINHLEGKGAVTSTGKGWDLTLSSARMITASSFIELEAGRYYTATFEIMAKMNKLEIAPDTLALFWKDHPIEIPLTGAAEIGGDVRKINFKAGLASSAGEVTGEGTYDRDHETVTARGTMQDLSLEKSLRRHPPASNLSGSFEVLYEKPRGPADGGTTRPRRVKARLELLGFSYPGVKSFPMNGVLDLTGDDFVASVISEEPGTSMVVQAGGAVSEPYPLRLRAAMSDVNPASLREGLPEAHIAGLFRLDGKGNSLETFSGAGELSLEPTVIEGVEISRADSSFSLSGGRINIDQATMMVEGSTVTGSGWIEPARESAPFSFDVRAALSNPRGVAALFGEGVSIRKITISSRIQGNKNQWTASGSGELLGIEAPPVRAESSDFKFDLAGRGGEKISGTVTVLAKSFEAPDAHYRNFAIPAMDLAADIKIVSSSPRAPRLTYRLDSSSSGPDYGFHAAGDFKKETAGWELGFESLDLLVMGRDWKAEKPARLISRHGSLKVDSLEMASGAQSIGVDGAVVGEALDMSLSLQNVDAGPWSAALLPGNTIAGLVTAGLAVKGPSSRPVIHGDVSLADPLYQSSQLTRAEATLDYEARRLEFKMSGESDEAGVIEGSGTVPVEISMSPWAAGVLMDEKMSIELMADNMSAALIGVLIPGVTDVKGRISVTADIEGTPAKPIWNGNARVEDGSFNVPELGIFIHKMRGGATLVDNKVDIPAIVLRSGDGKVRLNGSMRLAGFSISNLDLLLESFDFTAMNTPDTRLRMDGEIKINGDLEFPKFSGWVKVKELMYRPPLILTYQGMSWEKEDPTVVIKGQEQEVRSTPFLDRSEMDIQINIPDTGQLRNSELNIRMGGQLSIKKPPGGFFLLFGLIESKEGWVIFQGKPFRVERGSFKFSAIPVIDPDMDILASYRVPDYTTYIHISGTLLSPVLELYSNPSLDPADVLSVILFGKPSSQLAEGQRQSLASSGGQIIAGYAAAGLARSLSDTLKLDTVILQAGGTPETTGVGFGKYLNDQLYLFYYHRFGTDAAEEFRLRYELRKNLSIEAGQDEKGQGAVDVYYSHPY